ncbi:PREDICTED: zinc finger CCCH domain-containing protein 42-like [Camelina sativa]|uniref:Zinc finger CCCH domain-containing protein 42-like n=1 Tax=Camelina sativa TaxID=90675 RepID=A0ABM0VCV3_CAMSA|nr:PREDICTED: zinc finger CCCH domain-containing protein 42-like [Camelina sativa]
MNLLTMVKLTQRINAKELDLGISDEASWHAKFKDSAYVYVGRSPYDLTEGDLLAVFEQYGEVVDVNLVRDKGTGKSKGFAFVAYEDQRSTNLAVDNLNGAKVLGRIIKVEHRGEYLKREEEEDDETKEKKREARGVCRAFQRRECTRGDSCKFSHDENRELLIPVGETKIGEVPGEIE